MKAMTGAQVIVNYLLKRDINCAFGIPGNQLNELLIEMKKKAIHFMVARHEGGASLMAEGYAKVSKKVGVCITIPGPGVSNAYTGILEAYNNHTPVLLITIAQESKIDTEDYSSLFHGFDQQNALKPVTKWCGKILKPDELMPNLDTAFSYLAKERSGPVMLEFGESIFKSIIPEEFIDFKIKNQLQLVVNSNSQKEILKALELIKAAKYPFILAGEGIYYANASEELIKFATKINAPVATTTLGKGAISEYEDLALGSITDMLFNDRYILELLAQSDLLIAIGVKFTQVDTEKWSLNIKCPMIHIDSDKNIINKVYQAEVGVSANIKVALQNLSINLDDKYFSQWGNSYQEVKVKKEKQNTTLIKVIREVLDQDSIFVADINIDADYALARYKVSEPWNFLFPGISLMLGFSIPAAIGAQIARPKSRTVVLCGDGGFIMSSQEIATIVKYNLKIVILIVNDNAYGTVKYKQLKKYNENIGVNLSNPDFIKFAEAYGICGVRIDRLENLKNMLAEVIKMNKPVIVEIDKKMLVNDSRDLQIIS